MIQLPVMGKPIGEQMFGSTLQVLNGFRFSLGEHTDGVGDMALVLAFLQFSLH